MHNAEQMQNESKQDEAFWLKAENQDFHVEPVCVYIYVADGGHMTSYILYMCIYMSLLVLSDNLFEKTEEVGNWSQRKEHHLQALSIHEIKIQNISNVSLIMLHWGWNNRV